MEMHTLDSELNEVSAGQVDIDKALKQLRIVSRNGARKYESAEEGISLTCFTVSRDNKDYLRIECHSEPEVHFSGDRCSYNVGWFKRIFANHKIQFRSSFSKAEQVIADYFKLERSDFEAKYEVGYTNNQSLVYAEI